MSANENVSVQESQVPATEAPEHGKDTKSSLENAILETKNLQQTNKMENTVLNENEMVKPDDKLSALDSSKPKWEIDAFQKHVEESLLFLDQGKETSNVSEIVENLDINVPTHTKKQIIWEKPEKIEKDVLKNTEESTVNNSLLEDVQSTINVSENSSSEQTHIAPKHERASEKMEEDIENNGSEQSIITSEHEVDINSTSAQRLKNSTDVPELVEDKNNILPDSTHIDVVKKDDSKLPEKMDEVVENKESEASSVTPEKNDVNSTSAQQVKIATDIPESLEDKNDTVSESTQIDIVTENESKLAEKMDDVVENNESESSCITPEHGKTDIDSTSAQQVKNATDIPESIEEKNNMLAESTQIVNIVKKNESKLPEKMDEVVENSESEPLCITPEHGKTDMDSKSTQQVKNATDIPGSEEEKNNTLSESTQIDIVTENESKLAEKMDEVIENSESESSCITLEHGKTIIDSESAQQVKNATDIPESIEEKNNMLAESTQIVNIVKKNESKLPEKMDEVVVNSESEPLCITPEHGKTDIDSKSTQQVKNATDIPGSEEEKNNTLSESTQIDIVTENESKLAEKMDEVIENSESESSCITLEHGKTIIDSESAQQVKNATDIPESIEEKNNMLAESTQIVNIVKKNESKLPEKMDEVVVNSESEPLCITPEHGKTDIDSKSTQQVKNATDIPGSEEEKNNTLSESTQIDIVTKNKSKSPEKMDEVVENNESEPSCITSVQNNKTNSISTDQLENATGIPEMMEEENNLLSESAQSGVIPENDSKHPEKMDEDQENNDSEPPEQNTEIISISTEQLNTTDIPAAIKDESKLSEKMGEENDVLLKPTQVENIVNEITITENINNNVNNQIQENVLNSILSERAQNETVKKIGHYITPIKETVKDNTQETVIPSEQINETLENNVYLSSDLENNDKLTEQSTIKSQIYSESVIKDNSSKSIENKVTDNQKRDSQERLQIPELSDDAIDNVQSSEFALDKTSTHGYLKLSTANEELNKDVENTEKDANNKNNLKPQTTLTQKNAEKTQLNEREYENKSENNTENKKHCLWETSVSLDKKEAADKMDVDIDNDHSQSSQTANQQVNIQVNAKPEHEKELKEPESIIEIANNKNHIEASDTNIKQNVDNISVSTESYNKKNDPKIVNQSTDQHIGNESQTAVPQKNIWESPILHKETLKPEKVNEDGVHNAKRNHSGALKTTVQEQTQKRPENVVYNEKSAHSGSLKVLYPSPEPVPEVPNKAHPKETGKTAYNTNSAHQTASLKVVPISEVAEYPPAKRSRIEPTATKVENTETVASIAKEDSLEGSPVPSETVQWETAFESGSNRPQSSCSSMPEDTSRDVESDDASGEGDHAYNIPNPQEFLQWCKDHGICKENYTKNIFMNARKNKGVIKIDWLPKTYQKSDVLTLIKNCTWKHDMDIVLKICYTYLDKRGPHNTAYVRWKNENMLYAVKALELINNANIKLVGTNKVKCSYFNSFDIKGNDWVFIHADAGVAAVKNNRKGNKSFLHAQSVEDSCEAFVNGEIDITDKVKFGLNKKFLDNLKITPPLICDVVVKNVGNEYNDREVRETFCLAGVIRDVIKMELENDVKLIIKYTHPLEAVQAISMFHHYVLNERVLIVELAKIKHPAKPPLPEAKNLGRGLGFSGKPLLAVRSKIELGEFKKKCNAELQRLQLKITNLSQKLLKANETIELLKLELSKPPVQSKPRPPAQTKPRTVNQPQPANQSQSRPVNQTQPLPVTQPQPQENAALTTQNTLAALTTVIASSIQNNIMGMLGIQPNMQQSPNTVDNGAANWSAPNTGINWNTNQPNLSADTQTGQSYPHAGLANMQPNLANMQPNPANMQGNMYQEYVQPTYITNASSSASLNWSTNTQGQTWSSNLQTWSTNMPTGPTNNQAQPMHMQSGQTSIQPGPSNIQPISTVQPQSLQKVKPVVQSNPIIYPPLPPTNTSSSQPQVKSRFDIPPGVAKPQIRGQLPPAKTAKTLDIPLPIPKPQNRGQVFKKIPNPNLKVLSTKTPKSGVIKFNIPSLKEPDVEKKAAVPTKLPAYETAITTKTKSPVKETLINKQIKAIRRSSKSPEKARNTSNEKLKDRRKSKSPERMRNSSPQHEKAKAIRRKSRSPDRSRNSSSSYDKSKATKRNSRSPDRSRNTSSSYDKSRTTKRKSRSPDRSRNSPPYDKPKAIKRKSRTPDRSRNSSPYDKPKAIKRKSRSPDRSRNSSPYDKPKAIKRKSRSPDRSRNSPPYDKPKVIKRDNRSPDKSRNESPYDKPKAMKHAASRSPDKGRTSSPYDKAKAIKRASRSPDKGRTSSPYERPKEAGLSRERDKEPERSGQGTVYFKYLPSSVTEEDLREKMQELGPLVEVTSASRGFATVTFLLRGDAETCIEMYNRAKVDGQTIEVKWAEI